MSGGGGGGGQGGPGFPDQGDPVPCEDLEFTTALSDPIPEVIEGLQEGAELSIELQTEPRRRIAAVTAAGELAGSIATQQFDRLLDCLQAGHNYEAEILTIDGGAIRVRVRPA